MTNTEYIELLYKKLSGIYSYLPYLELPGFGGFLGLYIMTKVICQETFPKPDLIR